MRPKWRLIGLFWAFQAVIVYFVSIPLVLFVFDDEEPALTVGSLTFVAVFFGLQLLFLLPIRRPSVRQRGVPIFLSLAVGGLLVAGLVTAAFYALTQFADLYLRSVSLPDWVPLGVLATAWLISTPLLIVFCRRGRREAWLQRLATGMFLGTIIEAAAIIPLDLLVRRRDDCVCAAGTFLSLAICSAVGLFVLGPAVLLPLLAARRTRWNGGRCEVCGYDMKGRRLADVCPECGAGWRRPAPTAL